jgi:hypothetical protein
MSKTVAQTFRVGWMSKAELLKRLEWGGCLKEICSLVESGVDVLRSVAKSYRVGWMSKEEFLKRLEWGGCLKQSCSNV